MLKRRVWLALLVATVGMVVVAFAVQIRTWHGRGSWIGEPHNKVLVATWLESEMWIDPWLLLIGITTMVAAAVVFFTYLRLAHRREAEDSSP